MEAQATPRHPSARRGFAIVLPVLYVAGTAVYVGEVRPLAWITIAAGTLVAFLAGRAKSGETLEATRSRRIVSVALGLVLATSAWSTRGGFVTCTREIAALVAVVFAARSIGAIAGESGLATRAADAFAVQGLPARSIAHFAIGAAILTIGSALLLDGMVWTGHASDMERLAPVFAAATATIALVTLGACAFLTAGARRLELAAPPRALAAAAATAVALFVAIALAIAGTFTADAAALLACAIASAIVVRVTRTEDALRLARRGRRALTLALFGGPIVTLAAISAEGRADASVILVLALVAMLVGALGPKLEEPLLPWKGRMLDALADATRAAHDRDARDAIARALARLRDAAGEGAPSPELWMLHPTRVFTVDAAGYLRERDADIPPALFHIAADEPDATLRIDVLRALEVRRPDLRPLLQWMDDRGALFATLIHGGDEPDGVLIAPMGTRVEPLTIEEVRAAKDLADAFVAICQMRSARERHFIRERELRERVESLDDDLARLRHTTTLDVGRNALAATRLARPATVGIYSAVSRMAYDALERRVELDAPVVLVARAGVDPVPYLARAHLSGPRKDGPLVIVDGTSSREHDLSRWKDHAASPLALADRGLLVLVDGSALPRDIQVIIARTLIERRPPWERAVPLDIGVALTALDSPARLLEDGRLSPELHARFEDATPIELPGLRERSEDLFSIVADRLAREGLRVCGRPIGIDAGAFGRLVEHPFDGEDAELTALVTKLVALVASENREIIRPRDLDAVGLPKTSDQRIA